MGVGAISLLSLCASPPRLDALMSVSGCETIVVNSGIKLEIQKQNASAPREWQMKGWKKERQRRQQLRKDARKRKQISHDLNIWYERMKQAALQTAYHNIWLNNTRKDNEPTTDKS